MNGYYSKVVELLKQHHFYCDRQKGAHQNWTNGHISVTVSTNCVSRHTANAILKRAGIDHKF